MQKAIISAITILMFCGCKHDGSHLNMYLGDDVPDLSYALANLHNEFDVQFTSPTDADIKIWMISPDGSAISEEGFSIERDKQGVVTLLGIDEAGLMYGLQDIAEQLQMHGRLDAVKEKSVNPAFQFRGIKFNLPWSSYRAHESMDLHLETARDTVFWKSFLDMMARNRFNVLTLWNLHPFPYMVQLEEYPEASGFDESEMKEWKSFWHWLFRNCEERSIQSFVINWNVFVSPEYAEFHNVAAYCRSDFVGKRYRGVGDYSPEIQKYLKACVIEMFEEYPLLNGFGVSQNERLEGLSSKEIQEWVVETYFDVFESANQDRAFILRGHTIPSAEDTRSAIEANKYRLPRKVWVPLKFNWSHSYATSHLHYIHGGSSSDAWWNPFPNDYQLVFTIRNEDFFALRWGRYDFVRTLLQENDQRYIGGYLIGSEGLIPAKEYMAREGRHKTWRYAFQRQWLYYMMWGRMLYNPQTPSTVFAHAFNRKYDISEGDKLLEAHNKAGFMPQALASMYQSTWDFTLYAEGFLSGYPPRRGELYDDESPFISVEELMHAVPIDTNILSIKEYVENRASGPIANKTTPLQLAEKLSDDGHDALKLIGGIETSNSTLQHEIADVESWAYLSLYMGSKIKGAVNLYQFELSQERQYKSQAISHLQKAVKYWRHLVGLTDQYYKPFPLVNLGTKDVKWHHKRPLDLFSWKALLPEVERDVEIARQY